MSFSPKYGMIMADGAGDARNGKTPLRGVCGAQNAAAMAFRAAAAPSFRSVTKSACKRTYCTQNGLRRRLTRRFFARESGVPQLFTVRLLLRLLPPCFSLRLRCRAAYLYPPAARGRRCERREGGHRACRTRNGISFCGSRHFPLAACRGQVAAIRSGRSRIRRGTAAFWPQAAAALTKGARLFETAHLQNDRRMGSIVKC